jgi:hypothetical protein
MQQIQYDMHKTILEFVYHIYFRKLTSMQPVWLHLHPLAQASACAKTFSIPFNKLTGLLFHPLKTGSLLLQYEKFNN